jgi:uncharacterized membrane protein/transglutaminase-like putative cysteine protease
MEPLEARVMLDGAASTLAPALVVGRTLSSYTVSGIQNHRETITYTVYNEQSTALTGVLLTTTLQTGVTFAGASVPTDQNGQNVAWSLGTIAGFDRVSVTVSVTLASSVPLQLDSGARAFAVLNAGMVSDSAPAAVLSRMTIPAGTLDSTPDANTTDPFIQEEAAKLDYDPSQIFDYLHTQIGYNSYAGSVRGARGTLWSNAGNSLDVASLGVALMRASGIPAQYVQGTLSQLQAQQLILSMFPASDQTVGYIPTGTTKSDPANDPTLLSQTEDHYWFQFDAGSGMEDADPLMAGATIGHAFTSSSGTFTEVADQLRAKTEIQLNAETYNSASALFGLGGGLSTTTVLDQTFNDVDLVGHPVTAGVLVSSSSLGAVFSSTTTTYTPYLEIGDDASPDPGNDVASQGTPFEDVQTNFPLGSQVLTGYFMNVTETGPGTAPQSYTHTIFDRIGYAARNGLAAPNITIDPSSAPALNGLDLTTLNASPGLVDPHVLSTYLNEISIISAQITAFQQQNAAILQAGGPEADALSSRAVTLIQKLLTLTERSRIDTYLANSGLYSEVFASEAHVAAYAAAPILTILQSNASSPSANTAQLSVAIDLLRDVVRAIAAPGQAPSAAIGYQIQRGFANTGFEAGAVSSSGQPAAGAPVDADLSAQMIFTLAREQGVPLVVLTPANPGVLQTLDFPADAMARISDALENGMVVIVPAHAITIDGSPRVGWYQSDTATGQTVGMLDDGNHLGEYTAVQRFTDTVLVPILGFGIGFVAGFYSGQVVEFVVSFAKGLFPDDIRSRAEAAIEKAAFVAVAIAAFNDVKEAIEKSAEADPGLLPFYIGFLAGSAFSIATAEHDPSASGVLFNPAGSAPPPLSDAENTRAESKTTSAGAVQGSVNATSGQISGSLQAAWTSTAGSGFQVGSISAPNSTVIGSNGQVVGLGTVGLSTITQVEARVSGSNRYTVNGVGSLSFFGPAESALGVSGEWSNYTASVTGTVSITITTDGLTLNGQILPAGTYTIKAPSATLTGSGPSTSPDFTGSASVTAAGGTLDVGIATGNLSVGGKPVDPKQGVTLTGYTGTVAVAATGSATDVFTIAGNATDILSLSGIPATVTTHQNTPVSFKAGVSTSLADAYTFSAHAPAGWAVSIDDDGNVTAIPAPGLQGGTYTIRVAAQSTTNAALVAQAVVEVMIVPTQPGMTLSVAPDPLFTVPFNGALVPTGFQAAVRNTGPVADTYTLTFSNLPAGFTGVSSAAGVTVPAGQTGVVGIYLIPTGQLPAPGTVLKFDVTVTSTTDRTITSTQTVTFTVPRIDALVITANPSSVNTTPGVGVTETITITNAGNVDEDGVALAVTLPTGLTLTGLTTRVALAVGASTTETITLTPAASTPLNSALFATFTATYGASASPMIQTARLTVDVVVPGAEAVANASVAAGELGEGDLANRLGDLSAALTNLVQDPASPVFKSQALASVDSVIGQLGADPIVAPIAGDLAKARATLASAGTAAEIQAAVIALGHVLDSLGSDLTNLAEHRLELSIPENNQVAQPLSPATFGILLRNTGTETTTYLLSLESLSPGLKGTLSQDTVTLAPGAFISSLTATLTPDAAADITALSFVVRATAQDAPAISATATGLFTARAAFVSVVSVATDPAFVNPGGTVNVSARVLNAVNREQQALASFVVKSSTGQTVFTSQAVPLTLGVVTSLATVALGALDTTGFALGEYTITVTLTDASGQPIPGGTGEGSLLVGSPVTSTMSASPNVLPTGTSTVTNTLTVNSTVPLVGPLGVQSQTTVPGATGLIRNGNLLYVGASDGIRIYDITDPTNPQLVRTFGTTATLFKIHGDKLYALTPGGAQGNIVVSIYSITDPANPTLLGATPGIPYSNAIDMVVTDTHVFVVIYSVFFFLAGNNVFEQTGDILSIDVSDPASPHLDGVLRNTYGTDNDSNGAEYGINLTGGDGNLWSVIQADPTTLLVSGSTSVHGDTQTGSGVVYVIDISDPTHMSIVSSLTIPGTLLAFGLTSQGDRAFVTASTGGWNSGRSDLGFTGQSVLATLDISNPRNPKLIATETLARASRGYDYAVSLDNGLYAYASLGSTSDQPEITVVNDTDPTQLGTSSTTVPAQILEMYGEGNFVYTVSTSGLIIYQVGAPNSVPVTASVEVPRKNGVAIVPGSFSIPPTQIISGTDFDTYEWKLSLGAGSENQTITWQSTVTGMQPGESRPVTLSSSVAFTSGGTPGQVTLPALQVSANQILGLDPASRTVAPGAAASYTLAVSNPTNAPVTYALSIQGVNLNWSSLPTSVAVPAGGTVNVPFTLTAEALTALGDHGFAITASAPTGATGSVQGLLTLAGAPILPDTESHGVVVSLIPAQATAGQGTRASYVARITNTGSAPETFALMIHLPAGMTGQLGQDTVDLAPGASNAQEIPLTLTAPAGTTPGSYNFTVDATATSPSGATGSADGKLNVVAFGVKVDLTPLASNPPGTLEMTVTNMGTVTDTFDLALAGPASLVASLARTKVTLAAGASQTIAIATKGVTFAVAGSLGLTASATSEGNRAVKDTASASLTIASSEGLTASLTPSVKVIPIPGTSSFVVVVNNTGNTADSYSAAIVGTHGPITASLVGLDGLPANAIPIFHLPGLATGSFVIQADMMSFGRGTVTVKIQSLSDPSRTATVSASAITGKVASTTTLKSSSNSVKFGQAITYTAIVGSAAGTASPTGRVVFYVDGVARPAVALHVVGGRVEATFTTSTLAVGSHQIKAVYGGDATHVGSPGGPLTVTVNPVATLTAGPRVIQVSRFGYHATPTTYVIQFSAPLDSARAENVANYRIVGPDGRSVPVASATYDAMSKTVTLAPAHYLNLHWIYRLTIIGTGTAGITDTVGVLLDGAGTGHSGSNYVTTLKAADLVVGAPAPAGPMRLGTLQTLLRIEQRQANQLRLLGASSHARAAQPIHKAAVPIPRRFGS